MDFNARNKKEYKVKVVKVNILYTKKLLSSIFKKLIKKKLSKNLY